MTLITCGGAFDPSQHMYVSRWVVRASRILAADAASGRQRRLIAESAPSSAPTNTSNGVWPISSRSRASLKCCASIISVSMRFSTRACRLTARRTPGRVVHDHGGEDRGQGEGDRAQAGIDADARRQGDHDRRVRAGHAAGRDEVAQVEAAAVDVVDQRLGELGDDPGDDARLRARRWRAGSSIGALRAATYARPRASASGDGRLGGQARDPQLGARDDALHTRAPARCPARRGCTRVSRSRPPSSSCATTCCSSRYACSKVGRRASRLAGARVRLRAQRSQPYWSVDRGATRCAVVARDHSLGRARTIARVWTMA